jgi:hypothetical protein
MSEEKKQAIAVLRVGSWARRHAFWMNRNPPAAAPMA